MATPDITAKSAFAGPSQMATHMTAMPGNRDSTRRETTRDRRTANAEPTRASMNTGTSSAPNDPTGGLMVTICFQPSTAPNSNARSPPSVGTMPHRACCGTAAGTPTTTNTTIRPIGRIHHGQRRRTTSADTRAPRTVPTTIATTNSGV